MHNPMLASLDISLAFDRVPTQVVEHLIKRLGMPTRIFQLARQMSRVVDSCGPLPQGDSWSPLTMDVYLLAPLKVMDRKYPSIVKYLYVDDRAAIAPANELHNIVRWMKD